MAQHWISRSAVLTLGFALGCAPGGATSTGNEVQGTSSQSSALVVFHTSTGVFTAKKIDLDKNRIKTVIEDFFPAACIDDDADGDRSPDELDDDSDSCESRHSSDDADGGLSSNDDSADSEDRDDDDDDDDGIDDVKYACKRCNRGPGTQGDFRLETEGEHAKLARGHVIARNGNQLQVASPEGPITIEISADTEVKDGDCAPGAEIRAEGVVTGTLIFTADRIDVLCPAPGTLPAEQLPAGAEPVPTTSTPPPAPSSDAGIPGIN